MTRKLYKCFGCGKGGDAFRWLVETEGLSFPESVEKLAAEPAWNSPNGRRRMRRASRRRNRSTMSWNWRRNFYEAQLFEPAGARRAII